MALNLKQFKALHFCTLFTAKYYNRYFSHLEGTGNKKTKQTNQIKPNQSKKKKKKYRKVLGTTEELKLDELVRGWF